MGNWFAFKYALRRKAAKLERTNLTYGAMARMVREGGLLVNGSYIPVDLNRLLMSLASMPYPPISHSSTYQYGGLLHLQCQVLAFPRLIISCPS